MEPPSKKHGFGKFPPISDLRFSDFAEKCVPPPLRMAQMGGRPHFEPPTRDGGGVRYRGEIYEKFAKKGGTPFLGTFWRFWGFPVKTVCHTCLPGNPSQQRKRYTTRRGPSPRPSRVYFALSVCPGPKYTLERASEMTHEGWLASSGRPVWHTVFTGNPQNRQKVPKKGYPPFRPLFQ